MSDFADLLFQRAEQAYAREQFVEAEGLLRMLLGRSSREAHVTFLLGHLRLRQGDPTEAEALLRSAIELDGTQARAHDDLGVALAALGRHAEARELRLRGMELDPEIARQRIVKSFDALRKADFATGWDDGTLSHGRPAAVAFSPDGRLFLSNDQKGDIYWFAPL